MPIYRGTQALMRNAYARDMYWAPSAREPEGLSCPSSQPMPSVMRDKTPQKQPDIEYSFPGVDERLVVPETSREEMVRGEKILTMPANPPHAEQQQQLSYLIQSTTKSGFVGATDMLTRTSERSDFAVDTSIRRKGIDPRTGRRYLEELAFEIVDTQTDQQINVRAEDLAARGVRRIFAIFVRGARKEVCEWSKKKKAFEPLGRDGVIDDLVFVKPISVRAILEAAEADNEVVRALDAKGNPVLGQLKQQAFERGLEEGKLEGERCALIRVLEKRFGVLSPEGLEKVRSADSELLELWMDRALEASDFDSVFRL